MKNFFNYFMLILTVSIFVIGCSTKPEKVLPKKDGKWNYELCLLVNGNPQQCETGVFTFEKKGEGNSDVYGSFTWTVSDDKITLVYTGGINNGITETYTIAESDKSHEKWLADSYNAGGNTLQQQFILTKN